jgi:hypothetical protein
MHAAVWCQYAGCWPSQHCENGGLHQTHVLADAKLTKVSPYPFDAKLTKVSPYPFDAKLTKVSPYPFDAFFSAQCTHSLIPAAVAE